MISHDSPATHKPAEKLTLDMSDLCIRCLPLLSLHVHVGADLANW